MIIISFGKWSSSSGSIFKYQRIYWNGYKWTPFVKVSFRYIHDENSQLKEVIEKNEENIKKIRDIQKIILNQMADFDKKLRILSGEESGYSLKKPRVKRSYRKKEKRIRENRE